jgi:DNA-binding protein HU-beta
LKNLEFKGDYTKMTKANFITALAEKTNITKKDVTTIVDVLPEVIKEVVASGDKISLTGFISFEKVDIPEKTGVVQLGDKKGSTWTTPAHSEVKAKLSKSYKTI